MLSCVISIPSPARGEAALSSPLKIDEALTLARAHRSEIVAARARARAAAQRPAQASALEEPMVSASIDHLPFSEITLDRRPMFDRSLTIEQRFPLSRIRRHRTQGAEAQARRASATAEAVGLDVELEVAAAFWMLAQSRGIAKVVARQHGLADQLVAAATARYSTNTGTQSDVLRAQIEVARLDAEGRATAAEVRGAEVMLNTSLARPADAPIPELDVTVPDGSPPPAEAIAREAGRRPELRAGRAEIEGAEADVRAMRSMYAPMAMLRTGPAYTMEAGTGWMVMIGVSIPIWRGKLRAGVAEASAMVDMANADLEAMQRMLEGQARAAREAVVAARERYRALRDVIVPRAEQAIAPTLAAYASGQVPLVSVVEAAQALWGAERELLVSRAELGLAWARLRRASGEGDRR
jgi:outer membrane protein TolC